MLLRKFKRCACIAACTFLLSGCRNIANVAVQTDNPHISAEETPDINESQTSATTEETTAVQTENSTAPVSDIAEAYDNDWALFVVNEDNPLPDGYSIVTKAVYKQRELDVRCADYAIAMIEAALDDGIELNVTSGYRSAEKQKENIKFYIEKYMGEGLTYEEAEALTYSQVAKPGCSEHNAGVAMDIVTQDWFLYYTELTEDFQYTDEFRWLQENSWKYGFIMSFPEGKEDITGFSYEPWHYRFVGIEHAEKIHSLNTTLNEYLENNF